MNPLRERQLMLTRRQLFGRAATGIGTVALGSLLGLEKCEGAERMNHEGGEKPDPSLMA